MALHTFVYRVPPSVSMGYGEGEEYEGKWTPGGTVTRCVQHPLAKDCCVIDIVVNEGMSPDSAAIYVAQGMGLTWLPDGDAELGAVDVSRETLPAIPDEEIEEWPDDIDPDEMTLVMRDRLLEESDRIVRGLSWMENVAHHEIGFIDHQLDRLEVRRRRLGEMWGARIAFAKVRLEQRHRALARLKSVSKTWDTGYGKALLRMPDPKKPPKYKLAYDLDDAGRVVGEKLLFEWAVENAGSLLKYELAKSAVQDAVKSLWKVVATDEGMRYVTPEGVVVPGIHPVRVTGTWSYQVAGEEVVEDDE